MMNSDRKRPFNYVEFLKFGKKTSHFYFYFTELNLNF